MVWVVLHVPSTLFTPYSTTLTSPLECTTHTRSVSKSNFSDPVQPQGTSAIFSASRSPTMSESVVCATRKRSLYTLSPCRSCPFPALTLTLLPSTSRLTTTADPLTYVNSNLSAYICRFTHAS